MQEPTGELVELDFYFGHVERVNAFERVVRFCCTHGGRFAGTIWECKGIGARRHRFTSLFSRTLYEIDVSAEELEKKLEDENIDVIKVAVWSAIGITKDVPEVVTYNGVSSSGSQVDNPAIAIVGEGWVFSGPPDKHDPKRERQAKKAGKRCYEKFVEICAALDPDYAAILGEDSLPCSYDLADGRGDRCFRSFFVSERAYQGSTIARIEALYKDAYKERIGTGIYVSTWGFENPGNLTIPINVALERSARVAKMLAIK